MCPTFPGAQAADETGTVIESNVSQYKLGTGVTADGRKINGIELGRDCYVRMLMKNNETLLVEGPKFNRPVGGTRSVIPTPEPCSK